VRADDRQEAVQRTFVVMRSEYQAGNVDQQQRENRACQKEGTLNEIDHKYAAIVSVDEEAQSLS
jgi:hypothetical protein